MFTDRRLTHAFKKAKVEYLNHNSKYIFFSDAHRGDDSVSDEFARNQVVFRRALDYYYHNGYKYVEVGDGDELWEYREFRHIRLAHSDIFALIKEFYDDNRLIMLFGNHNIYIRNKRYVRKNYYQYYDEYTQDYHELFKGITPIEALVLKYRPTKQNILIVHGHQGDLMNDQLWHFSMLTLRYFWRFMHVVGFQNPSSPARNQFKRHKIEKAYKKWILNHKMMLICGHTHRPKFPKKEELPYFNTGCCIHSRGINGIEIVGNQIMMVDWRIRTDREGSLHVERAIVRGPEPISTYDFKTNHFMPD